MGGIACKLRITPFSILLNLKSNLLNVYAAGIETRRVSMVTAAAME
jgi:hypothetical protein